jgi:hypothetical protein
MRGRDLHHPDCGRTAYSNEGLQRYSRQGNWMCIIEIVIMEKSVPHFILPNQSISDSGGTMRYRTEEM